MNARIQSAQFGCEVPAVLHFIARRNDSSQNCPRVDLFQVCCKDANCHDCVADFLYADQIYEENILGVVAQNVINQLPSKREEEILTQEFGQAAYEQIDQVRSGPGKGKTLLFVC